MSTSKDDIYFQLRFLFRLLYGAPSHKDPGPCVLSRAVAISPEESACQCENEAEEAFRQFMLRPAYERLIIPAYTGNLVIRSYPADDPLRQCTDFPHELLSVRSNLDFIRLHFFPFFREWESFISSADNTSNLQDLMGRRLNGDHTKRRNSDGDHGAGSTLKEMFRSFLIAGDADGLQMLRLTQTNILYLYKYSPIALRTAAMRLFAEARKNESPDCPLIRFGLLDQIERIVMELFSHCLDDSALTVLLICTLLRDRAEPLLPLFSSHPCMESISLKDSGTQQRIELGDGYYILAQRRSNYVGGTHLADITLLKERNVFIRKITDIRGYFFTKPEVSEQDVPPMRIFASKFPCEISPFRRGLALFTWMLRPDGRYWTDDDGFGATDEEEILLYALMNQQGEFVTPFAREIPVQWLGG